MTDRELLELAAKAAGYKKYYSSWLGRDSFVTYDEDVYSEVKKRRVMAEKTMDWNPLTNDGDALRLAVKRRFHINIFSACSSEGIDLPGFVEIWCGDCDPIHTEYVEGGDYETATRRAIVRAAAELGRNT